jgi:hypothetical protein
MALAYMKPGWDLQGYTALMIDPVIVSYQTDPRGRQTDQGGGAGSQNFALSDTQMENFKNAFQETVGEAMSGDGGLRIVDTPGRNVLRLTAELMDLVIAVPTREAATATRAVGRTMGAVTLVIEVRDSQSGEIIARAAERREPGATRAQEVTRISPTFLRSEYRRLFEYWATLLRDRFDELREVEIDPVQ